MKITKNDPFLVQQSNVQKCVEFSTNVSQTPAFLSSNYNSDRYKLESNRFNTSIADVMLEDAKLWITIFDTYPKEVIKDFFLNCAKECAIVRGP